MCCKTDSSCSSHMYSSNSIYKQKILKTNIWRRAVVLISAAVLFFIEMKAIIKKRQHPASFLQFANFSILISRLPFTQQKRAAPVFRNCSSTLSI